MAKKEETTALQVQNKGSITVYNEDGEVNLNIQEAIANLGKLNEGASLSSEYMSFEDEDMGVTRRLIYIGLTTIKKINGADGETTEAAKFIDLEGNVRTNADRVLVSTSRGLKAPKPISVTFTGWEKSGKGKYRMFDVKELN